MAGPLPPDDPPPPPPPPAPGAARPRRRWPIVFALLPLLLLAAAAGLAWFASETQAGRDLVARRLLPRLVLENGLSVTAERIEGSLLAAPRLQGVALRDQDGVFATAPRVELDWSARALLGGRIRLARLEAEEVRLLRLPRLIPAPPEEPLLPDIRLSIERFAVRRLVVEEAVAGVAETVALAGRIALADRVLVLALDAAGTKGDRLRLLVDAAPDADRFDLEGAASGDPGGLLVAALGLAAPVRLDLSGEGGWARWQGVLNARVGPEPVATLGISARSGAFQVTGTLRPRPLLPEALAGRLGDALAVDAAAAPAGEATDLRLAIAGDGLGLSARGRLDRRRERLSGGNVRLELADPGRLLEGVTGESLSLEAALEGPVRALEGTWRLEAPRLRLADGSAAPPGLDGLAGEGALRWEAGRPVVPFVLTASRAVGFDPALADLLAAPRLAGTLRPAPDGFTVPDLRLETAAARAEGRLLLPAGGRWQLEARAEVPRLALAGGTAVGASVTVRAAPDARGETLASGTLALRALALPEGARRQLGGLPQAAGTWRWSGGEGVLRIADGRVAAPALQLGGIVLDYALETGRFTLAASGTSAYGPVALAASGTAAAPRLELRLAEPGLGLALADVLLSAVPVDGGFALAVSGSTPQGPLAASGRLLLPAEGPLALELAEASLGGVRASGLLVQDAEGPFVGRLGVSGDGLDGTLDFVAEGRLQRIVASGTAAQARLPLPEPVIIGAGTLDASVLLAEGGPRLSGRVSGRNIVRGGLRLGEFSADGTLTEAGGEGTVSGAGLWRGRMLRGSARVTQDASGYGFGFEGRYGELPFRLARQARLVRTADGWRLEPARIVLPRGHVDVAGSLGRRSALRLALVGIDLAEARLADRTLAVRGRIDGQLDLVLAEGDALPTGRARLVVREFSRPSPGDALPMIDLDLEATSGREGLAVGARLSGSRGSTGRLVLRLLPGAGATVVDRLLAGAIAGGVRYAGPAETPWSFLDVPDQELTGAIGLAADFGGTLGAPRITGGIRGQGLAYRNLAFNTRLADIAVEAAFDGPVLRLSRLSARADGGTLAGSGTVRLSAEGAGAVDLAFRLDKALLADSPTVKVVASGPVALTGTLAAATLSGALEIDSGVIRLGQYEATAAAAVPVRRKGEAALPPAARDAGGGLRYDLRVTARDSVKVDGLGLDSFWGARVRITGTAAAPKLSGEAVLARGTYDFAGRAFEIRRGRIGFTGAPLDSTLDIQASSRSEGFEAGVRIAGTAARPEIGFTSSPPLPEDEVLARLLFGTSVADLSVTEAVQLAAALASLRGGSGGFDPVGRLQRASGIDRIRLQGGDERTGLGTAVAFGERIGRNLYVEVATDTAGNALTRIELALTRVLGVLAEVTTLGNASVNLRYARDY
ncbi:translocation/assembly module TamB domain-containing protein [Thermaurantiacus tibetensis]|uniref:translocation/assembly module TamB domain-containing protein n=1 Tax=Thermaurantiacus tibetensis TaxID=2759035 RepID=UPI00188FC97D|nr:translocation/assembly module TamB domain-containing protein [Thermaurantiacus tibetensis]